MKILLNRFAFGNVDIVVCSFADAVVAAAPRGSDAQQQAAQNAFASRVRVRAIPGESTLSWERSTSVVKTQT